MSNVKLSSKYNDSITDDYSAKSDNVIIIDENIYLQVESKPAYDFVKRVFDVVAACIAFVILLPLMLVVALIIYIDDPHGSPIFSQYRSGKNGKLFKMYKFRSMVVNAESELEALRRYNEMDGPVFKIKDDPRITSIGKFIRATSIDELPQLINIIKGDMSVVGPRPALPHEVEQYDENEKIRLAVLPGLTCYWQISPERNSVSFSDWMELDKAYINERSLVVDFYIICKTIPAVIGMHGR